MNKLKLGNYPIKYYCRLRFAYKIISAYIIGTVKRSDIYNLVDYKCFLKISTICTERLPFQKKKLEKGRQQKKKKYNNNGVPLPAFSPLFEHCRYYTVVRAGLKYDQ